jgi:hypothetical protein
MSLSALASDCRNVVQRSDVDGPPGALRPSTGQPRSAAHPRRAAAGQGIRSGESALRDSCARPASLAWSSAARAARRSTSLAFASPTNVTDSSSARRPTSSGLPRSSTSERGKGGSSRRRPGRLLAAHRRVSDGRSHALRARRRRAADGPRASAALAGLIHHSDQGSQFVSLAFGQPARDAGIAVSLGLRGVCWATSHPSSSRFAFSAQISRAMRLREATTQHTVSAETGASKGIGSGRKLVQCG